MNFFLLPILILFVSTTIHAADNANAARINDINSQIEVLQEQLKIERRHALNESVEAQPDMRVNWGKFIGDIEGVEDTEHHVLAIKKEIQKLEEEKKGLETLKTSGQ
jgi:hypothetical protein